MPRFEVLDRIGSGGFAVVHRIIVEDEERECALKELTTDASEEDVQRFRREVRILAQLKHKNIVSILGYNLSRKPPCFVMPLAECNLQERLQDLAGNERRITWIFSQILDGIEYAHDNNVIHRDLKPQNVLFFDDLFQNDLVKIADFGIGKRLTAESISITRSYQGIGSPPYSPPEQVRGLKRVDVRGDIYALGKILYEMFTGEVPLHLNLHHTSIPDGYRFIMSKCVEYDPGDRYQSIRELRDDFNLLNGDSSQLAAPVTATQQILQRLVENPQDTELLRELDMLFASHVDDEHLYIRVFPNIPLGIVVEYYETLPGNFLRNLERFDSYVSGGLAFSYTDTVADFYRGVYAIVDGIDAKKMILNRIFVMGYTHNRFHVRDVFCTLLEEIDDSGEVLMARDIIRSDRSAANWHAEVALHRSIPSAVREAFSGAEEVRDDSVDLDDMPF